MIEIVNPSDSVETEAAYELRDLVIAAWPGTTTDRRYEIGIVPNARCYGQKREEIDLLVFGRVEDPLPSVIMNGRRVLVRSFCFAVEVKDHPLGRVRFSGNSVDVNYKGKWENASQQNHEQMGSILNYLKAHQVVQTPFVQPLLWLRNIPTDYLPKVQHNILSQGSVWEDFLKKAKTIQTDRGEEIRALWNETEWSKAVSLFTKRLQPSRLDRQKMERVSETVLAKQQYAEKLGEQLLIISGRAGTGKTVRLIRLAHDLYQRDGARVLILTYNKALVSDIKRLFALLNIRDGVGERSIRIQTVHSFIRQLLVGLGIIPMRCDDFLDRYEPYKDEARDLMAAVGLEDIASLFKQDDDHYRWDYIFIDEAQDWFENERDILFSIYDFRQFVLADGIAQLARNQQRTNWRENVDREKTQVVTLREIIRMKKNLSIFVREFTHRMGLDSRDIQPYKFAEGGEVIIVEGPYLRTRDLHEELLARNAIDGNEPVDMLFCVPPKLVKEHDGHKYSIVGKEFEKLGQRVWDGVAGDIRESYPTELDQLRLVTYDSCRGLEGWIVVNLGLDSFYDHKLEHYLSARGEDTMLLDNTELAAHEFSARWLMIPLTRAVDTLVIQVSSSDHKITEILREISEKFRDFVDWRHTD